MPGYTQQQMTQTQQKSVRLALALFGILSLALRPALAWNGRGHEAVAAIAYTQLTPDAKKAIDDILAADPRRRTLAEASVWPDEIRRDPAFPNADKHAARHYIDIPYRDGQPLALDTMTPFFQDPESVTAGIKLYAAELSLPTIDPQKRADDLSWLIHLVGDIHQPLHCTTRITADHPLPAGDRGGNDYAINAAIKNPDGTAGTTQKLHAFWDLAPDLSPTAATSDALTAELMKTHPVSLYPYILSATAADADGWAVESYRYVPFVYSTPEGKDVSPEYVADAYAITADRLARAGYRLAAVLNNLFAPAPYAKP